MFASSGTITQKAKPTASKPTSYQEQKNVSEQPNGPSKGTEEEKREEAPPPPPKLYAMYPMSDLYGNWDSDCKKIAPALADALVDAGYGVDRNFFSRSIVQIAQARDSAGAFINNAYAIDSFQFYARTLDDCLNRRREFSILQGILVKPDVFDPLTGAWKTTANMRGVSYLEVKRGIRQMKYCTRPEGDYARSGVEYMAVPSLNDTCDSMHIYDNTVFKDLIAKKDGKLMFGNVFGFKAPNKGVYPPSLDPSRVFNSSVKGIFN